VIRPKIISLHGPESTGKSTLAAALARRFGTIWVPEYGRTYCEEHGTDLVMADLIAIAEGHRATVRANLPFARNGLLFTDTDPLMTAVWADMMMEARDPWFNRPWEPADLYLIPGIDMPFVQDHVRIYGDQTERRRFYELSIAELDRRRVRWIGIDGPPATRFDKAIAALAAAGIVPSA
jgi:NadR type nicotinamide-nucleotide adenylyltransferase